MGISAKVSEVWAAGQLHNPTAAHVRVVGATRTQESQAQLSLTGSTHYMVKQKRMVLKHNNFTD